MGLMNKMRDKTHIILIILIVAFLATIVFEWGMDYLGLSGGQVPVFASVNGQEITYTEFENQVQFSVEQQKQQTGEEPDETVIQLIRDQVWDQMVSQVLVQQEIEKLGIKVTNQEILNWVYNSPQTLPDPIKRNFIDSTGQFNMAIYQQALATKTPEVQKFWSQVEEFLKQTLLSQKLQSVITASVRVSEGDIMQKFKDGNIIAAFSYIFLDVNSVPDVTVPVSETELKDYYEKNKDDFKSEESVKLKYVLFSDSPNAEDSSFTEKQLKALTKELKIFNPKDTNLLDIVNSNSLTKFSDTFIKPNELASEVADFLFSAARDSISGVIRASDGFHLVKLLDVKESENVFTKASHILINFGTDTNSAKLKAEQIKNNISTPEDFTRLAQELSDDPSSKVNGGNLGWFTKGVMVKEFEDAVNNAKVGDIIGPVRTQYGFHIIRIVDRAKKEFKIADIKKLVKTSIRTRDAVRKSADDFAFICRKGSYEEEATKLNMQVMETPPLTRASFVPGAGQNKSVIRFAFSEKSGSVSDPVKIQGGYAVYLIVEKIPKGYMRFEDISNNMLMPKVILEKKLDILKQQALDLRGKIAGNELTTLKNTDPGINILDADSVSVEKPDPTIGNDFDFNSVLYKLQNGQISEPIRTQRGYYIVQMKNITPFNAQLYNAQSEVIRNSLITQKRQSIVQEWITELKEKAEIVDNRDKFYR